MVAHWKSGAVAHGCQFSAGVAATLGTDDATATSPTAVVNASAALKILDLPTRIVVPLCEFDGHFPRKSSSRPARRLASADRTIRTWSD